MQLSSKTKSKYESSNAKFKTKSSNLNFKSQIQIYKFKIKSSNIQVKRKIQCKVQKCALNIKLGKVQKRIKITTFINYHIRYSCGKKYHISV